MKVEINYLYETSKYNIKLKKNILQDFRNYVLSANQCHCSALYCQGKSQSETDLVDTETLYLQKKRII